MLGLMPCSRSKETFGKPGEHTTPKKWAIRQPADISFINIFGTYFANKADALKDWSGTYCDVKSISITDAAGTMLSPTVGILTFKAAADGTCYGQKVGPIWGTSVYVKHGDVWKWTFGINLPARREGTWRLRHVTGIHSNGPAAGR